MEDKKMLQAILDRIILTESNLKKEMKGGFEKTNKRLDNIDKRLDRQGRQLAYLEDDAPTREEFDSLDKRVVKIERKLAS